MKHSNSCILFGVQISVLMKVIAAREGWPLHNQTNKMNKVKENRVSFDFCCAQVGIKEGTLCSNKALHKSESLANSSLMTENNQKETLFGSRPDKDKQTKWPLYLLLEQIKRRLLYKIHNASNSLASIKGKKEARKKKYF